MDTGPQSHSDVTIDINRINTISAQKSTDPPVPTLDDELVLSAGKIDRGAIRTLSGGVSGVSSSVSGGTSDGPDSNVSVAILCRFEIESSCVAGYVAEGRPSDFLPTQDLKWTDSCDVIFKSRITDGDKQEWIVADMVMNDD